MKVWNHLQAAALITTFVLASPSWAKKDAPDADEIVKKADEGRLPPGKIIFLANVKDYKEDENIRETRYQVSHDPDGKTGLIETTFPDRQKGRKLLMENDNLWLHTPDTKRPARVSQQQRLTGELSNGDLARTYFHSDYDAELVSHEDVKGEAAFKLLLKAKRSGVTYSKIEYWVREKDFMPLRAVYFAVSGKKLKSSVYSEPKEVLGRLCMTKILFTDILDPSKKSVLTYSKHRKSRLTNLALSKEGFGD